MKNIIKTIHKINENQIFSPLSLYFTLCLLAKVTSGDTKKEVLNVLELKDDELLDRIKLINETFNKDDENRQIMLKSSMWFADKFNINFNYANKVSEECDSAIKSGKMGTREFDEEIHEWINSNTKNLLKDSVEKIKTVNDEILTLISTIYLKGRWSSEFEKNDTRKSKFYISKNKFIKCDFMKKTINSGLYVGEHFKALPMNLSGLATMMFVLPNDGYELSDIKDDEDLIELLDGNNKLVKYAQYLVNFKVPKFDLKNDNENLIPYFNSLGITKALNINEADFTPISNEKSIFISDVKQASRLKIDEEGVEAASYSILDCVCGSAIEVLPLKVDFVLNRPFMFSVVRGDMPVFVGTVVDPTK